MSKYLKLPALQGNLLNMNNSELIDFEVPDFGSYNLQKSYLSVMVNANTTETSPGDGIGVHAVYPHQSNNLPLRNNCFIGDYDIKSDKLGSIDNLLSSNILNCNLDILARDFEQMESENYKQLAMFKDTSYTDTTFLSSMFRSLNKSEASQETPFELKIPLNQFSTFGNNETYNASQNGRLRIHTEFKPDHIEYLENVTYPRGYWYYHCANIAAATVDRQTISSLAYGNIITGTDVLDIKNTAALVVTFINATGPATVWQRVVVDTVPTVAAGVTTIHVNAASALPAGDLSYISLWKLHPVFNDTLACNDVVAPAGNPLVQNVLTLTDKQDIAALKSLIGSVVVVQGTNLQPPGGAADAEFDTVLTDVQFVDSYDVGNSPVSVKVFFKDNYTVAAGATASPIRLWITQTKLMPAVVADIAAHAQDTDITVLTMTNLTLDEMNFWIGKKVNVNCIINNAPVTNSAVINNIDLNAGNPRLSFDRTVILQPNGQAVTNIGIRDVPAGAVSAVYSQPNLVVQYLPPEHKLVAKNSKASVVIFPKFNVEVTTIPTGTRQFNKLFQVEPTCKKNLFAIFTKQNEILSSNDNLESYRWRINNIDKTNLDIEVNSALETDNIIQTFGNSTKLLKSLDRRLNGTFTSVIPMTALPLGQYNMVQLILNFANATTDSLTLYLYKECIAEL